MTDEEIVKAAQKEGEAVVVACLKKAGAITGILANENALMIYAALMQESGYPAVRRKLLSGHSTEDDIVLVEKMAQGMWEAAK